MYFSLLYFICLVIVFINLFTWHFGNVELILVICLSNNLLTNTYYMYM